MNDKLKDFLTRKLNVSNLRVKKLKRKRKIINILYYVSVIVSVSISAVLASVSLLTLAPMAIAILSMSSACLTALSGIFKFKDKSNELRAEIEKLNKLQEKLDYIVSCNGDLTSEEYREIMREFS